MFRITASTTARKMPIRRERKGNPACASEKWYYPAAISFLVHFED